MTQLVDWTTARQKEATPAAVAPPPSVPADTTRNVSPHDPVALESKETPVIRRRPVSATLPETKAEPQRGVTSTNQSGGITAGGDVNIGTLNTGPVPRVLTAEIKAELVAGLTKKKRIYVIADLNCSDCEQLTRQIKSFLTDDRKRETSVFPPFTIRPAVSSGTSRRVG